MIQNKPEGRKYQDCEGFKSLTGDKDLNDFLLRGAKSPGRGLNGSERGLNGDKKA